MESHSLESLGAEYGETLVSLETFSRLLGEAPGRIRARRAHDSDFPTPVTLGSTQDYRLSDLVEWVLNPKPNPGSSSTRPFVARPDPDDLNRFALDVAVRQCAAAHGAEASLRLVGGAALALVAGWSPTLAEARQDLLAQIRKATLPQRPSRLSHKLRDRGFVPDPHPAMDAFVRSRTIEWIDPRSTERTIVIASDSHDANRVIMELVRCWLSMARSGDVQSPFALLVDQVISPLASLEDRGASATQPIVTGLLSRIVHLNDGDLVCDPACGEASTLLALAELTASGDEQTIGIVGRELKERIWLTAKIRLGVRDIEHQLGRPDQDSLEVGAIEGSFDLVIVEPGFVRRQLAAWFALSLQLTATNGTALVVMPAIALEGPKAIGSWWFSLDAEMQAIVRTPGSLRPTVDQLQVCVLRHTPRAETLVVDATRVERTAFMRGRTQRGQRVSEARRTGDQAAIDWDAIELIAGPVRNWLDDRAIGDDWRFHGLSIATLTDLHKVVTHLQRTVEVPNVAHIRRVVRGPSKPRVSAQEPPEEDDELSDKAVKALLAGAEFERRSIERRAEAIELALESLRNLRWLIDKSATMPTYRAEPYKAELEEVTTEEMRRALRRLEQRLTGKETRGRGSRPAPERTD